MGFGPVAAGTEASATLPAWHRGEPDVMHLGRRAFPDDINVQ